MKNVFGKLVFNWSELLLTSWFVMLIAGALGASLDWGTVSFWQALGGVYLLKCLVNTAAVSFINTIEAVARSNAKR